MSVERQVLSHFHTDARRFDAIYAEEKGALSRWVDDVWRGVVRRRFDLTVARLEPLKGKSVLDVGCGSGRYCLAYAQRGAAHVVGVDFAPAMIDLANEHARRLGLADRCEFRQGTFPEAVQDGPFDCCTAMGFFDYIENPAPLVARMRQLTRSTVVMSFPKSHEWRVPLRRLRFRFLRCPLILYSRSQVRAILKEAGIQQYDWVSLDRDYIVIAHQRDRTSRKGR
jgi:2-polyprenyl-3-methyl-5-hydroxy-6-metoxy-1,4-benzoquinol methylase